MGRCVVEPDRDGRMDINGMKIQDERRDFNMEERKTAFDYLGQVFITFGFSIVLLNILCVFVGESAQEVSTIFSMGNKGLSAATMAQFFAVSVCITALQALFFTDRVIRKMSAALRLFFMVISVVGVISVCALMFGWFPVNMWQSWAGFFISFALCFAGSLCLMILKEQTENRKMEEALRKLQEREKSRYQEFGNGGKND